MSNYTSHLPCPHCGHNDCYTVWDNGGYYCNSCMAKGKGTSSKPEQKETTMTTLKEEYRDHRGITRKTNEFYGIANGIDSEGVSQYRAYPYPDQIKYRHGEKDFSRNKGFRTDALFGSNLFNAGSSKQITICEGEEDVASAYQMLGSKYPVVGLPTASISKKNFIKKNHEYLDSFKEIIICTDGDEAGDRAAMLIAESFPNKTYRVRMTKYKDPNEFLTNGASPDFMFAHLNREKYIPEFDVSTPDKYLEIYREGKDSEYVPTGILGFDENHLGLMQACLTVFQAPEGVGKTELFRYFEHHLIKNHPEVPFGLCHLEEPQIRSVLGLVSYDLDKNVTRKELVTNQKEVEDSIRRLTANENVHMFSIGIDEDPNVLVERIQYYATVCECKYIFIEPLQDIAHQRQGSETTEQFLTKLSVMLSRVAAQTGVGIITIAHENDDGAIRDCRMIGKQASVVVRLERDKTAEDEETRNTTTLVSLKNRPASFVGYAGTMTFDMETFKMKEKL